MARSLPPSTEEKSLDAKKLVLAYAALVLASLVLALGLSGCQAVPPDDPSRPSGRTLYVSSSNGCGGERPCYTALQDALDAAGAGDVIKVAGGVYVSSSDQVIKIDQSVHLIGGYPPEDWTQPDSEAYSVIVDAEQIPGRRAVVVEGSEGMAVTLEGLRIMRGGVEVERGGCVYVGGGSVVLAGSVIEDCRADARGGGVFVRDGSVRLTGNVFRGNAAQYGGALYVEGGSVTLERNQVFSSEAPPLGGAIGISGGAVTGFNNVVAENALAGAGVYLSGGTLEASHWTLVDNGRYGVIVDLGIEIDSGSATVHDSIVASHQAGFCGSGAVGRQTLFHDVVNPCIAGASCVNNLFGDPKFRNPFASDYHITTGSAAVDRAYSVDVAEDVDEGRRPVGAAPDLGADELEPHMVYLPMVARGVGR